MDLRARNSSLRSQTRYSLSLWPLQYERRVMLSLARFIYAIGGCLHHIQKRRAIETRAHPTADPRKTKPPPIVSL